MDYTMANKKREMANKMVTKYSMKGGTPQGFSSTMGPMGKGGQRPKLHGDNSGHRGGMKYPMAGARNTATKGEKAPMQHEPTKPLGHRIYSQNGPDRHTA